MGFTDQGPTSFLVHQVRDVCATQMRHLRLRRVPPVRMVMQPCSCRCGGSWAWLEQRASGGHEMVGCVCHRPQEVEAQQRADIWASD